jgi:hypothetical protein
MAMPDLVGNMNKDIFFFKKESNENSRVEKCTYNEKIH